jgi:hypothetical protein
MAATLNKPAPTRVSPTSNWRPTLEEWEPSLTRAASAAAKFVADIEAGADPYWLTLSGEPGCGKTLISTATFRQAAKSCEAATANHPQQTGVYSERRRRPGTRWIDETRFAQLFLDDKQYDLPEHLAIEWLVCYDDLGSKRDAKDLIGDALYRLTNQRLGKWTLWSTNFSMEEIAKRIDPRVSSRLIRDNNRLVTITAGDYAKRPKGAR